MPHIILEHTKDIEAIPELLNNLHNSLAGQDTVKLASLKTRSILLNESVVADEKRASMVHVTVKLLPGRSDELRLKMTSDLQDIILSHCSSSTRVTVESMLLDAASYRA
jgi:5-carboxymethyl-2-hydroxymuconate isomerase